MSANSRWWFADLAVVLVLAIVGGFVAYVGLGGRLRVALVMPLVLFLPGYVLLSSLFPSGRAGRVKRSFGTDTTDAAYELGGPERVGLSVALSVAVVPLIAAAASFTPWGIRKNILIYGILGFTAVFTLVAFVRRVRVPFQERYSPSLPAMLFSSTRRADADGQRALLNIVIVLSFLLVASTAAFAMINPPQGQEFSEIYVETNNISSDVDSAYQTAYPPGENSTLRVNVGNHEESRMSYTVVAVLQRVDGKTVTEKQRLTEQAVTVPQGKTKQVPLEIQPTLIGENLRIRLLLYKGDPSGTPYKTARLWVSVQEGAQQESQDASVDTTGESDSQDVSETESDRSTSLTTTLATTSSTRSLTTSTTTTQPLFGPTTTATTQSPFGTTATTTQPAFGATTTASTQPAFGTTSTQSQFGPTGTTTTQSPFGTTRTTQPAFGPTTRSTTGEQTTDGRATTSGTPTTTSGTTQQETTTDDGFFERGRPKTVSKSR